MTHDPTTPEPQPTPIERRVTDALRARAAATDPAPDGLDRIEENLMSERTFTDRQRKTLTIAAVAAAISLFLVSGIVLATRDGDDRTDLATDTSTTATTAATTTTSTTAAPTTTATAAIEPVDPFAVAFPAPAGDRRFDDPRGAAQAYATEILGFDQLDLGQYQGGDNRSGEVPLSDGRDGTNPTTVLVRQMADDSWYVLGSQTPDIIVATPTAGAALASPFQSTGTALAFEGTVDVVVRAQGSDTQVGSGFVTGSGTPPAGPFDGRIFYAAPGANTPGVLVYRTLSAEDGHVTQATSFPVRLTDRQAPQAPEQCGNTADTGDDVSAEDVRVVKVFVRCDATGEAVPVRRTIPVAERAILRATLELLLDGPSDAETAIGFTSVFPHPDGTLRGVTITDGVATVDLSAAFASVDDPDDLVDAVVRTATQYSTVTSVELRFDGDCAAVAAWAGTDSCVFAAR